MISCHKSTITWRTKLEKFPCLKYLGNISYNQADVSKAIRATDKELKTLEDHVKNGTKPLPFSTSSNAKNRLDSIKNTTTHEYGHHRHYSKYREYNSNFVFNKNTVPTVYAKTNREEYFTEWFTHWRLNGDEGVPNDLLKIFKSF